jgi:copper transport protein
MDTQVAQRGRGRANGRRVRIAAGSLLAVILVALAGSVLTASPAAAHATVSKSEPADQSHSPTPPSSVTVWFSEAVSPDVGGMTVIGQDEREVQSNVHQPAPNALMAMLPADLRDGTYVATYRIISEDGHPITGSLVFGVGNAALADVSGLVQTTDATVDALSKFGQFLVYLGALAAAGLVFFLAFLYEEGHERPTLVRVARGGAAVAVLGMVVVLLAQTDQATGTGLGAAFNVDNLRGVLRQGLGAQDAGILVGLVLALASLTARAGTRSPAGGLSALARPLALVGGLVTAASFVLWGHAIEGSNTWLSIPADAVHLVVAAVWFGGLIGLFVVLRARATEGRAPALAGASADRSGPVTGVSDPAEATPEAGAGPARALSSTGTVTAVLDDPGGNGAASSAVAEPTGGSPSDRADGPATGSGPGGPGGPAGTAGSGAVPGGHPLAGAVLIVRRFSAAAFVSLLLLSAAGVALGLVEMGGLGSLFTTAYGRLLLAKLAVVAVVAAAAGYNRYSLLPDLLSDGAEPDGDHQRAGWKTLLSTVRFEALAIVAVLGLTAVLVNTTPGTPPVKAAPSKPLQQSQPLDGGGQAALAVSPNRPGGNAMHVDVTGPDGRPRDVRGVQVEFALPAKNIGPITRTLVHGGPGHYMLESTNDLSLAGDWTVDVLVLVDEFDEQRVTFQDGIS